MEDFPVFYSNKYIFAEILTFYLLMKNNKQVEPLSMMMLPQNKWTYFHNNEVFVSDNLDRDIIEDSISECLKNSPLDSISHPFKIKFSIAILCLGGSIEIRSNMNEYKLTCNDIVIIPAGTIGQYKNISNDCKIITVAFSADFLNTNIGSHKALLNHNLIFKLPIIFLNNFEINEFINIYENIKKEIKDEETVYKNEIIQNYINIFQYHYYRLLIKNGVFNGKENKNRRNMIFDQFMQLLEEYHTSERKIGFYADKLCLTAKYLSQVIHEVSDRHASEWIKDFVILEAKALLKSKQYTVQQVSDMLNFANQSFFGVYFKNAVGCSPLTYQNKL